MTIFRFGEKLIYFSHVPKAGGSSVESYLTSIGGVRHFFSIDAHKYNKGPRGFRLPPQHIPAKDFESTFDVSDFSGIFSFVRHPEDRLVSEYRFRFQNKTVHSKFSFSAWIRFIFSAYRRKQSILDGHIIPQTEFLGDYMKIFRLEDGFPEFVSWLEQDVGISIDGRRSVGVLNASPKIDVNLSRQDRGLINSFYERDFELLGYQPRAERELSEADPLRYLRAATTSTLGVAYAAITR